MPRFTPNLTNVIVGIPVLPKGSYTFSLGELKVAEQTKTVDGAQVTSAVVRLAIKVEASDDEAGESMIGQYIPVTLDPFNEYGAQNAKALVIAAHGYPENRQAEFNAEHTDDEEWALDPETNEIGSIWSYCSGRKVQANVTQRNDKNDPTVIRNNFKWFPFTIIGE